MLEFQVKMLFVAILAGIIGTSALIIFIEVSERIKNNFKELMYQIIAHCIYYIENTLKEDCMTIYTGKDEKTFTDKMYKILKGKELKEFEIKQSGDRKKVEIIILLED